MEHVWLLHHYVKHVCFSTSEHSAYGKFRNVLCMNNCISLVAYYWLLITECCNTEKHCMSVSWRVCQYYMANYGSKVVAKRRKVTCNACLYIFSQALFIMVQITKYVIRNIHLANSISAHVTSFLVL